MKTEELLETAWYRSPIGWLEIKGSDKGIRSVVYLEDQPEQETIPFCLADCLDQLKQYFNGERTAFSLKLDPAGTAFQLRVWELLLTIPYGCSITYLQLALLSGDAKAVRAVGHANGQNRLNIIIPCHRVIGANGKLTGYGGGLWRKAWLLKHETLGRLPGLFSENSL